MCHYLLEKHFVQKLDLVETYKKIESIYLNYDLIIITLNSWDQAFFTYATKKVGVRKGVVEYSILPTTPSTGQAHCEGAGLRVHSASGFCPPVHGLFVWLLTEHSGNKRSHLVSTLGKGLEPEHKYPLALSTFHSQRPSTGIAVFVESWGQGVDRWENIRAWPSQKPWGLTTAVCFQISASFWPVI